MKYWQARKKAKELSLFKPLSYIRTPLGDGCSTVTPVETDREWILQEPWLAMPDNWDGYHFDRFFRCWRGGRIMKFKRSEVWEWLLYYLSCGGLNVVPHLCGRHDFNQLYDEDLDSIHSGNSPWTHQQWFEHARSDYTCGMSLVSRSGLFPFWYYQITGYSCASIIIELDYKEYLHHVHLQKEI